MLVKSRTRATSSAIRRPSTIGFTNKAHKKRMPCGMTCDSLAICSFIRKTVTEMFPVRNTYCYSVSIFSLHHHPSRRTPSASQVRRSLGREASRPYSNKTFRHSAKPLPHDFCIGEQELHHREAQQAGIGQDLHGSADIPCPVVGTQLLMQQDPRPD